MSSLKVSPEFIDHVKNTRKKLFGSVKDFATTAGIGPSTTNNFLSGKSVNTDIFKDLATILGLDWSQISVKSGGEILILDDEALWIEKFRERLKDFSCYFFDLGEDVIQHVENDKKKQVKLMIIDEFLLIDEQWQPDQGKQIRAKIRKKRSDIKFIIISHLNENSDPHALNTFNRLRSEPSVLDVIPKSNLLGKDIKEAGYSRLMFHVHSVMGTKNNSEGD
jgi:hypothetical protein